MVDTLTKQQVNQSTKLLKELFNDSIRGFYLYGSALVGGLQKYSDIDLFVVIDRPITPIEKEKLVQSLLAISGLYMKSERRPIELTLVQQSSIDPWCYPPEFEFQYGEWLREDFEKGHYDVWPSMQMPDLALLITQVKLSSQTLLGIDAEELLPDIPYKDFIQAISDDLPHLMGNIDDDTRNVLLTSARIWKTLVTDIISSKPKAAMWAIEQLPEDYKPVLQRAKSICEGLEKEHWDDLKELIKPTAQFLVDKAEASLKKALSDESQIRKIKLENNL